MVVVVVMVYFKARCTDVVPIDKTSSKRARVGCRWRGGGARERKNRGRIIIIKRDKALS